MTAFEGIWVPLITPFRNERLDLDASQRLVRHLVAQGIDGLVVCGTTGEPATLSESEQERLLGAALEAAGGECPVIFGISGNDTAQVAAALRRREEAGLAGFLVTAPYFTRPSQDGIRRHFEAAAAATERPIVIYNIPYRSGVNIEVATLRALAENRQFVAVKESGGGNLDQLNALITDTPLKVLSGEDALIFVGACLGGHGAISAAAHIRPDLYRRMLAHVRAGELEAARNIHYALLPLIKLLFAEPNPAPVKAALAMQGLIEDALRLPMTPASTECRQRLERLLPEILALP